MRRLNFRGYEALLGAEHCRSVHPERWMLPEPQYACDKCLNWGRITAVTLGAYVPAPEPREDVAVGEVLARVLLMHQDTYEDAPLIRCMCGERLLTLTEHVHHVATMQHVETAPLIAERERAAVERARDESAVTEVGLTDAEWTRLRHAAGNRGDLGPIAEEFERILGERVPAAAVEALREAADDIKRRWVEDGQHEGLPGVLLTRL